MARSVTKALPSTTPTLLWLFMLTLHSNVKPVEAIFRPIIPRLGCFIRFGLLRFDLSNYARYNRYFHGDSVMSMAWAGQYQGPDDIEEYVRFAQKESPYFADHWNEAVQTKFDGYDRSNKICNFFVLYDAHYKVTPNLTSLDNDPTLRIGTMVKLQFHYRRRYITAINVHYKGGFMSYYFGEVMNSNATREYMCNVYEGEACGSILDTPDDCEGQLIALSESYNGSYIDGNSQGCRVLHTAFASLNDKHCAHISFEPMEDSLGLIKCQESAGTLASAYFSENDLAVFDDYMTGRGMDPEVGYVVEA